jgi:hypothetical protein
MIAYLLGLSGMYSGRKKGKAWTGKLIGRGSYVMSWTRCVDGARNDHPHRSWQGIDEFCNLSVTES